MNLQSILQLFTIALGYTTHFTSASASSTINNSSIHEQNVAILVSSSTFFHNYRHTSNVLSLYSSLKKYGGYTDDNIILFLGDEVACNARNPFKNKVFPYTDHETNVYENELPLPTRISSMYGSSSSRPNDDDDDDEHEHEHENDDDDDWSMNDFDINDDVQVDYSGSDVTVENLFRVLTGRHEPNTPSYQKLPIDFTNINNTKSKTNLLLYITGHGGDNFFKFRDTEDFTAPDLRGVFEQLQIMNRFNSVLYITDTCQAFTTAPNTKELNEGSPSGMVLENVYSIGTSLKDESSYAHHSDRSIGHSTMDRYVHHLLEYMGGLEADEPDAIDEDSSKWFKMNETSLKEALIDSMYDEESKRLKKKLMADVGWSDLGCDVKMQNVPLSDFFVMKRNKEDEERLILDQVDFWR